VLVQKFNSTYTHLETKKKRMIIITQMTLDTCSLCLEEYASRYGFPSHTEARNYLIQQVMSVYDHNVEGILRAINFKF
jgi:hypothetical protein